VDRGVHLHQFAEAGTTLSAAAMGIATALTLPQSLGDQPTTKRLGADVPAFLSQLFAGEGRSKVGIALAVSREDGLAELGVGLVVGGLAPQAVDEGLISAGLKSSLEASDLADAFVEQPCGLGLGAFAA
jgi:hypothetical protein